ncbi:MAG: hypothetical protein J1F60_02205 [Oscillospiraceae bacterium]|nr:hypothetical protein [Oscillospiraceae bacterium]
MLAVMVSIRPRFCNDIEIRKKLEEVRKNSPKLETPFKVYIYCTKDIEKLSENKYPLWKCGKVIGEFVCDRIDVYKYNSNGRGIVNQDELLSLSCLSEKELYHYLQGKKPHAWHISDLVIYDKQMTKNIWDFMNPYGEYLKSAPQSWCYVWINE